MADSRFSAATEGGAGRLEDDRRVEARIRAEYNEMPGLSLTLPQAARLFDVDAARCAQLLEGLVLEGELWTNGHEFLARHSH